MGECLSKASQLTGTLSGTNWEIFEAITKLGPVHQPRAEKILKDACDAITSDEHVIALGPALTQAQSQALRLITDAATPPKPDVPPVVPPGVTPPPSVSLPPQVSPPVVKPLVAIKNVVQQSGEENLDLASAQKLLERLEKQVAGSQQIRLNVSWIIEE